MRIQTENNFITKLLKNTKRVIQNTKNFQNYYNNSNKSYYKEQLPILTKSKSYSLFIETTLKTNNNNKNDKNNLIKQIPIPLNNFRNANLKKKIIPKIRPLCDNIGLLNSSLISSKKNKRNLSLNQESPSNCLCSIPLNIKKNNSNFMINFFNDYEKDFFSEIDYSHLEYNEFEIYNNKIEYDNLIKEKIKFFKKEKNQNQTIKLEKNFHYGKYKKEINLTLNSLIITFEDMSLPKELQNKNLKIDFPFALLPLFYYKGIDTFLKLLSVTIKVENNFETISFDNESLYIALNTLNDYQTTPKEENEQKNYYFPNISIRNSDDKSEFSFQTSKIIETPISLRPPILKRNKYFLNFNCFIFFWTTNTRTFITKVTLPCINLNILDNKISIQQYIDYELLFFLYQRKFLNWEYYIIKYLSSFAKFRNIFQQLGSHNNIYNESFFLKQPKTKINTFSEEILLNIYTDQFNNNQVLQFKSFYIIVNFIDVNYSCEKIYHIYFSFFQYVKLYEIAKYSSKIVFLIKFLEINNNTHTLHFNYKEYDEFDIKSWMENIKKFSKKSLIKHDLHERLYREFDIYTKKIKMEFKKPQWSIIKFENKNEIIKTWEIGKELEIELVQSILYGNAKNWRKLLNECLKKLNEPVPVFEHSLSSLTFKKRNKKKDNKSISSIASGRKSKSRFTKIVKKESYSYLIENLKNNNSFHFQKNNKSSKEGNKVNKKFKL